MRGWNFAPPGYVRPVAFVGHWDRATGPIKNGSFLGKFTLKSGWGSGCAGLELYATWLRLKGSALQEAGVFMQ
jgi:hypothetical protein